MSAAAALAEVVRWTKAEVAALEAGRLDALEAATRAKAAALVPLADVDARALDQRALGEAAALHREAARLVARARARIDRRLALLARAQGAPQPAAYGADGRPVRRLWRQGH